MIHNQRIGTPASDLKGKQVLQESPLQGAFYNTSAYGASSYQPQMLPMESVQHQQSHFPQQYNHQDYQFSDTDFEAAFQDALQQAEELNQTHTEPREVYNSNGIEVEQPSQQLPIGSDAIDYIEQSDRTADQNSKDADELARTAGQLLTMVQHDTSDKMKNSQFLDLMRRIRDREVEVQNNDLQSTSKPISETRTGANLYMENETDFYHEIPQSAVYPQYSPNPIADTSTESAFRHEHGNSRTHDPNTFAFPDMDAVYSYQLQTGSAQTPTAINGEQDRYSSHDDEYPTQKAGPQSQIQALHPGGKFYPEQQTSPRSTRPELPWAASAGGDARMSGAVGANGTGLMNLGSGPDYRPTQSQDQA